MARRPSTTLLVSPRYQMTSRRQPQAVGRPNREVQNAIERANQYVDSKRYRDAGEVQVIRAPQENISYDMPDLGYTNSNELTSGPEGTINEYIINNMHKNLTSANNNNFQTPSKKNPKLFSDSSGIRETLREDDEEESSQPTVQDPNVGIDDRNAIFVKGKSGADAKTKAVVYATPDEEGEVIPK